MDDFDLGCIHMHTMFIHYVSQILDPLHDKWTFPYINIELMLPLGVEDLLNILQMFPLIFVEDEEYTTTKELVNGCRMSSIIVMKVVGALAMLKIMANH